MSKPIVLNALDALAKSNKAVADSFDQYIAEFKESIDDAVNEGAYEITGSFKIASTNFYQVLLRVKEHFESLKYVVEISDFHNGIRTVTFTIRWDAKSLNFPNV